jgi:thiol-disulfide isomerase/thioredoxin
MPKTLEETIKSDFGIVYVGDSETCPPCSAFKNSQEKIEKDLNLEIYCVNIKKKYMFESDMLESEELSTLLQYVTMPRSIPTFYIFKYNECIKTFSGFMNGADFVRRIKEFIKQLNHV